MNDSKVHNMQSYMAGQYLSEKPAKTLHMPDVLLQSKAKRHQKEKQAHIIGLMAAALSAALFVPLAYLERGYMAVGGEWIVVIMVYAATVWIRR